MSLEFTPIKKAVEEHFEKMCEENEQLFVVCLDKDTLWDMYLDAIPAEHNQIYKVRREFDCSCCRHFIKDIGNVVAINNGELISIWDVDTGNEIWNGVVQKLAAYTKSFPITDIFISKTAYIGHPFDRFLDEFNNVVRFEHFATIVPPKYLFNDRRNTIDTVRSEKRDLVHVFMRGLDSITMNSIDIVLDLIKQGSLYRGDEYRRTVESFRELKKQFDNLALDNRSIFVWGKGLAIPPNIAKIKNTAIGTLLMDISEGVDIEEAVGRYEAKTAPENYKRSKPIFTKKMLEDAQNTITDLGYLESLERRYANADDISVNNILFSNRETSSRIAGGASSLFDELGKETKTSQKKFDRVKEISIEEFINEVVPTASEIEAYIESKHIPNFMSLIAPVVKDSKTMFKWDNNFSWAYTGNVTDSMVKQNVAKAGGDVTGVLRFSIQWNDSNDWDRNDEDAHCIEPSGNEIYYSNKVNRTTGGKLDVDIINPSQNVPAVENITWPDIRKMDDGTYKFFVHCYSCRGGRSGFRAEIEFNGQIYAFDYTQPLKQNEKVQVAEVTLKDGQFTIAEKLPSNCHSREVWGIKTNEFTPVKVLCYSPNYWNEQNGIGNKHYFFMLKGCVNPELPNAWYNEFLNDELYPKHRKVMEALSSKAHVKETEDQLSGIGFSSTMRNDLVVKVKGSMERVLKIKF